MNIIVHRVDLIRRDNGLLKWNISKLPFIPAIQDLIYLPAKGIGGNHKHPRREMLYSFSEELRLFWLDEEEKIQSHPFKIGSDYFLLEIPPFVPHALKNMSETADHTVFEGADSEQNEVIRVQIV